METWGYKYYGGNWDKVWPELLGGGTIWSTFSAFAAISKNRIMVTGVCGD